jgi:hypothetical protein
MIPDTHENHLRLTASDTTDHSRPQSEIFELGDDTVLHSIIVSREEMRELFVAKVDRYITNELGCSAYSNASTAMTPYRARTANAAYLQEVEEGLRCVLRRVIFMSSRHTDKNTIQRPD